MNGWRPPIATLSAGEAVQAVDPTAGIEPVFEPARVVGGSGRPT